jgi:hypothetical protein
VRQRLIRRFKEQGCTSCQTRTQRLDAHHLQPSHKRFNISEANIRFPVNAWTADDVRQELHACIPLCRTCHRFVHPRRR